MGVVLEDAEAADLVRDVLDVGGTVFVFDAEKDEEAVTDPSNGSITDGDRGGGDSLDDGAHGGAAPLKRCPTRCPARGRSHVAARVVRRAPLQRGLVGGGVRLRACEGITYNAETAEPADFRPHTWRRPLGDRTWRPPLGGESYR